jgi:hypothetical protein
MVTEDAVPRASWKRCVFVIPAWPACNEKSRSWAAAGIFDSLSGSARSLRTSLPRLGEAGWNGFARYGCAVLLVNVMVDPGGFNTGPGSAGSVSANRWMQQHQWWKISGSS